MDGIKSKDRVKGLGEVYTPDSIVLDMLNGVNTQLVNRGMSNREIACETYLEPTCGNGQFLIRIVKDKIDRVETEWKTGLTLEETKRLLIRTISTVYGIDIDSKNIRDSKIRLMKLILGDGVFTFDITPSKENPAIEDKYPLIELSTQMKQLIKTLSEDEVQSIKNILHNNIIVGNMLDEMYTYIITYTWSEDNTTVEIGSVTLDEIKKATDNEADTNEPKDTFQYDKIQQHIDIIEVYKSGRQIGDKVPELYKDRVENWHTEEDYYKTLYIEATNKYTKEESKPKQKSKTSKQPKTTATFSLSGLL